MKVLYINGFVLIYTSVLLVIPGGVGPTWAVHALIHLISCGQVDKYAFLYGLPLP